MTLPHNNETLLQDPDIGRGHFFILGHLSQGNDGVHEIEVEANDPIAVKDSLDKAEIEAEMGVCLPLQTEWEAPDLRKQYEPPDTLRMIGAGGIVSVHVNEQTPLTVLFEKTAGPSKGKLAQASGISDKNPLQTLWSKIVEETGILVVDRDSHTLNLLLLHPAPSTYDSNFGKIGTLDPAFDSRTEQVAFFQGLRTVKESQIDIIRSQLPEELSGWDIAVVPQIVVPTPEDYRLLEFTRISLPNAPFPYERRCIVSDNSSTANVNLLLPVTVELPAGTEWICIDPEEFKRVMHTVPRSEMLTREFIDNRASVPMKPYLEKALKLG